MNNVFVRAILVTVVMIGIICPAGSVSAGGA